ncbi:hypothetical protein LGQ03_11520 [Loktanella sp. TSTF-M6]|uniref:N-acetyltransferase domain-containing protein n=1 Tax=Loktanella gaetbuli TaxID=2881335 RepID=A0ABS8BWP5_9RHOB|nr:hypothetical protein [Loktanella gaetbuli]MCB5199866.1 hypothetical protein [Loktanella gaetbuli]
MVAAIRWFKSALHPNALTLDDDSLDAACDPAALTLAIAGLNLPDFIHRLRVVAPADMDLTAFFALGFRSVRRTQLVAIDLNTLPLTLPDLPADWAAQWVSPGDPADWTGWFAAHWDHYARTHRSNPPRDPGPEGRALIFGGDDLTDALFVTDAQGALVAFGSLRADMELGWLDATRAGPGHVPAVLGAVLRRAVASGWTQATCEVDDDHAALWACLRAVQGGDSYVTLHRDV